MIHCVEQTPAATFCAALGKTLRIPIVWSSHTNLDYYIPLYIHPLMASLSLRVYQLLRRAFLNMADYNLTVSSDFVKLLVENGIKPTVHVWKTGVDSDSFNPAYRSHHMRMRMFNGHYAPDKVLLVSVGRLSPEKNFEVCPNILSTTTTTTTTTHERHSPVGCACYVMQPVQSILPRPSLNSLFAHMECSSCSYPLLCCRYYALLVNIFVLILVVVK